MGRIQNFMTCMLIINSALLGIMLCALFYAVWVLSYVVDQQIGLAAVSPWTQWAFDYRPKDLAGMLSLATAVTVTCLFVSLAFRSKNESPSAASLFFSLMASFCLTAGIYFFSFIAAVFMSQIRVDQHLYSNSTPPTHTHIYPQHLHPSSIDSRIWILAVVIYSLVLITIGIRRRRRIQSPATPALRDGG